MQTAFPRDICITEKFQPPWPQAGTSSLDQVAQSPISPDLEHFQYCGSHNFSGQPLPGSCYPHPKKFLPYVQSKSTLFQFKPVTPYPVTTGPGKKSVSIFLISPFYILKGCSKVSLEPSLLQAEQPQLSQPVLTGEVFHPSDHFCGPPLDPLQEAHVFPVLRTPELEAALQVGSHQSGAEGQNPLPRPAGHTALDAAQGTAGILGCEHTLPAHVQLFIHQYPQVLVHRAALNPFIPHLVMIPGIALTKVQDLALDLVELHDVHTGPFETLALILAAATVPYDSQVFFSTALEQKFPHPESMAHIFFATSTIICCIKQA
ncbi:uncharacterized protein ACIBXB_013062 [Morphnus guianensis]